MFELARYRDTYAVIRLDYLKDNVNTLYQKVKKPMIAILKANAYGHGYQEVANVLKDNPQLTCRLPNTKQPIRIICDTKLKIPITSQIVQTANTIQTWIATCVNEKEKEEELKALGCHIIKFPEENKKVPLSRLMKYLGEKGVDSVLLEGGSRLNWDALSKGIVNKIQCYIAPKIFGGETSKSPVGGIGVRNPLDAIKVSNMTYRSIGGDVLLEGEVKSCLQD